MKAIFGIFVFLLGSVAMARADLAALPTGALPIDVAFQKPVMARAGETISVRGRVAGDSNVTVVLRIDDGRSSGYATRVNDEHKLPPGDFAFNVSLVGAKTSGGRLIDPSDIRRLILFRAAGDAPVEVSKFEISEAQRLPDDAIGFSFGAADAPLIGGLVRVSPGDAHIVAGRPVSVRRPGLDPVVSIGIAGLERLHIDWPAGRAHVSMWTEDIGEWENLPRALRRRILVNGVTFRDETLTADQWIARVYLAGRNREAPIGADAWSEFGSRRGALVSGEVEVGADGINVELAGDSATATFLSAIVVERAGSFAARDFIESQRRDWLINAFPVATARGDDLDRLIDVGDNGFRIEPIRVLLAPGSGARARLSIRSPIRVERPKIVVGVPVRGDMQLNMEIYAAQRQLERVDVGGNLLMRTARYLRGDPESLPIVGEEPRIYEVWVSAPDDATPGVYHGAVMFRLPDGDHKAEIDAEVLPVSLPREQSPAGYYLDEAPHLTWFDQRRDERGRQISCDLDVLLRYGVVGNAPAFTTPTESGLAAFVDDARRAAAGETRAPLFAYTPLKRLLTEGSPDAAFGALEAATRALVSAGLSPPIWSVADEPANPDQGGDDIATLVARLRHSVRGVALGGQFNDPRDLKVTGLVDVALLNPGFGIDADRIQVMRRHGRTVWIYNTGSPRFTAGLWLWRTGAARYIQWHARMPSADPFDPTDGREGDVQIFPPMPEVCAARPDIHADLLDLAEGIVDQRWLVWLQSRSEPAAISLTKQILSEIPVDWRGASRNGSAKAASIRNAIMELARRLK